MSYVRTHTCGELSAKDNGKKVRISGWVINVVIWVASYLLM